VFITSRVGPRPMTVGKSATAITPVLLHRPRAARPPATVRVRRHGFVAHG